MKAYDNKTALLKSVLKTVMDPPGGLKKHAGKSLFWGSPIHQVAVIMLHGSIPDGKRISNALVNALNELLVPGMKLPLFASFCTFLLGSEILIWFQEQDKYLVE